MMKKSLLTLLGLAVALSGLLVAEEAIDLVAVSKIREEGLENSQVMEILWQLTDVAGPRLTGSPGLQRAMDWSRSRLEAWGLRNSTLEPWGDFGRGWSLTRFSIHMTEPYYSPIIAYPKAWTAGTEGLVSGTPTLLEVESLEDLKKYEGKLKGKIVVTPLGREAETHFEADARRMSFTDLEQIQAPREGGGFRGGRFGDFRRRQELRNAMEKFLREEGVTAILEGSRGEHGTLFVSSGGSREAGKPLGIPSAVLAVEHHARLLRLLEKKIPVTVEMELQTEVHDGDLKGYNVIAEIPGGDLGHELVMLGGHLDSWHAATGSTDNAAGCAVMMEAVRIIQSVGVQPRRTIRIALWSGEEQGLLGSRGYVLEHYGNRETMELKPEHQNFSGYFNLDNGTGKIRGVYLQGNAAVAPLFKAYLQPFRDLGADTLTMRDTGGTDHLAFDAVGLPGFQFIQDPIDYNTRTHHTNMDFYDHAIESDLRQAATIVAAFVYHTAMRDEKLPRKPLPQPRNIPSPE